jgi:hypothetical protein
LRSIGRLLKNRTIWCHMATSRSCQHHPKKLKNKMQR